MDTPSHAATKPPLESVNRPFFFLFLEMRMPKHRPRKAKKKSISLSTQKVSASPSSNMFSKQPTIHPANNELTRKDPEDIHDRQSKLHSHSYPDTQVVEIKDWERVEMLYNSLITSRGRHLRVKWIDYMYDEMMRQNLHIEDEGRKMLPILELSLKENDNPRVVEVILYCYLSMLGKSNYLYDSLTNIFIDIALNRLEYLPHLLVSMACYQDNKSIEFMLSKYINPTMDAIYASLSFDEELPEENNADDEETTNKTRESPEGKVNDTKLLKMINLMEAWQFCITFCELENIPNYITLAFPTFVELLDYPTPSVRCVSASCVASIAEMRRYKPIRPDIDLEDALKKMKNVFFSSQAIWDDKSKESMKRLIDFLEEKIYLVVVSFISLLPASKTVTSRKTAANRNKKGYPLTGYSEAFVLEYIHRCLKHTFSLFWDLNCMGIDGDFTNVILSIIARHPAYASFHEYIDGSREYTGRHEYFLGKEPQKKLQERNYNRRAGLQDDDDE
ncbi:uncharacterized protein LOC126326126 [Schistocerca gregaria]|uniref:uncharacterized protein LOC126326126 n=1 Tax=Schistocerca gregaria TaxID=7010 RepID=UPI00211EF738|nr:uncharacterized protein LOC126326126 [Schistocerca gregaria]